MPEAEVLRRVLNLNPLNLYLWRNTRGAYRERSGHYITYGFGPNGASDAIGFRVIRVTTEMVGKRIAQFCAFECKAKGEKLKPEQQEFIDSINAAGGIAAGVWSPDDAARALGLIP